MTTSSVLTRFRPGSGWSLVLLVLVVVGIRLPNLTGPLVGPHAWRQTDTASIAVNFLEEDNNILHPRIHWRGPTGGEIECEFPIYPWTVAQLQRALGESTAWMRVPAILSALLAVLGIRRLGRRWFGERAGWVAAWFMAISPLVVYFGRVPMGDVTMVAGQVWAIVWLQDYLEGRGTLRLMGVFVTASLAGLLKFPALHIGLPMVGLILVHRGWSGFRDFRVWIVAGLVGAVNAAWYVHANEWSQASGLSFGIWEFGADKVGKFQLLADPRFYERVFVNTLGQRVLTWAGVVAVILGARFVPRGTGRTVLTYWAVALGVFVAVAAAGIQPHSYYQIPFVPVAALLVGVLAQAIFDGTRARAWVILGSIVLIATFGMSLRESARLYSRENSDDLALKVGRRLGDLTAPGERVLVVDRGGPELFFYAERRGWRMPFAESAERQIPSALAAGVTAAAVDHNSVPDEREGIVGESLEKRFGPPERFGNWSVYSRDAIADQR